MPILDEAFARYDRLRRLLDQNRQDALHNPRIDRNKNLGLVSSEDRPAVARAKLTAAFDAMADQIDRGAVIDLCATFEDAFRRRAATAISEMRRVAEQHYALPILGPVRSRLVREPDSFGSLDAIFQAADGLFPGALMTQLKRLRDERNRIAHRPAPHDGRTFSVDQVRDLLEQAANALW